MNKLNLFAVALCAGLAFACSPKTSMVKGSPINMPGSDRDEHGCIGSAGYQWSEVQQDCIRVFEKGIRLKAVGGDQSAFIVFSPDSSKVELFFSSGDKNEILDRRTLPAGGYAWNVDDDDTKNVRLVDGKWTVSRRGKAIFLQGE